MGDYLVRLAEYFEIRDDNKVLCNLCPHGCIISPTKRGICQARLNKEGKLNTENYAMISSLGEDPIEKKPLYHFYPGSNILSVGTYGCNFSCKYCQNWQISQEKPSLKEVTPEALTDIAISRNSIGIAYTYSEPSIWFEYIKDTAKIASKEDLKNVMVTNGYIKKEPLKELLPLIDAANVDLKSINNNFYKKLCGGRVEPVLENIKTMYEYGVHLEITTLVITDFNDSSDEMNELFSWIADLNPDIPLHLSRYFPRYKLKKPKTDINQMKRAYRLAKEKLNYVYLGNVMINDGTDTHCPQCNTIVIKRDYYSIDNMVVDGNCPDCGFSIPGRF